MNLIGCIISKGRSLTGRGYTRVPLKILQIDFFLWSRTEQPMHECMDESPQSSTTLIYPVAWRLIWWIHSFHLELPVDLYMYGPEINHLRFCQASLKKKLVHHFLSLKSIQDASADALPLSLYFLRGRNGFSPQEDWAVWPHIWNLFCEVPQ